MSKVQMLRALVKQRLTLAAEEIFGLFERTIAEYEEELCRSKEENERQRKLLDAVFNPELRLHRADVCPEKRAQQSRNICSVSGFTELNNRDRSERSRDGGHELACPADVQQLPVHNEEVLPDQQEWSPLLDQEDPEPPHIKEEQEELWSSQEGEQLQGLQEADITKLTFTPVPVKTEDDDDEEKPQSSQLHQTQTEADGEDCGGPEPARNSDPQRRLQPDDGDDDCFKPEDKVSDGDTNTREDILGLNVLISNGYNSSEKRFGCFECGKRFNKNSKLKIHLRIHTGEKPFSCSLCDKRFTQKTGLDLHLKTHTGERPFACSVCGKRFGQKAYLKKHLKCHTGEKPYSCSFCNKCFSRYAHLQSHMRTHTGEKPFSCSVCHKRFTWRCQLKNHKCDGDLSELHELWSSQEGEQLQGLQEADITKLTFTPVPVKTEDDDDEEKPQSSQLHQTQTERMKTEADGEDCGGPEPARNLDPDSLESHGLTCNSFIGQFW